MFAVAGSQKTVQMQWVIPVYCSVLELFLCTETIYSIWIYFYVFEAKRLFSSFLYCEENTKFSYLQGQKC